MNEEKRVREEIAKRFCFNCSYPQDVCLMGKYLCTSVLEEADRIRKVKGLAVLADDQNPPLISDSRFEGSIAYLVGQLDLIKGDSTGNWRKVV